MSRNNSANEAFHRVLNRLRDKGDVRQIGREALPLGGKNAKRFFKLFCLTLNASLKL
jgi:hypothetical protein